MVLRLLVDAVHADETRVVIADNSRIHDFDFVTAAKKQVKGNIYLAKITRVEPSLQAAFVEYGGGKQGFLPFAEIHPDYYQIPMADRKRLLDEAEDDAGEDDHTPAQQAQEHHEQPEHHEHAEQPTHAEEAHGEDLALPPLPELRSAMQEDVPTIAETQAAPTVHDEAPAWPESTEAQTHIESYGQVIPEQQAAPAAEHSEPTAQGEQQEGQEIETLASDEDAVQQARPKTFSRRYKIQEVIKRNQIVLVQVIKEERGNKGVSLTTFISLAGRYCVLMPNSPKGGGISRKIMSGEDRKRLKEISAELKTARGMSAIIRTAGIDRTRAEIKRDYEYLVKLWETIREQTLSSTAPALIYEEGDLIKRTIRDLYTAEIEEIVVEGEEGFNQAKDFLRMILPSHAPKVKLYQDNTPLFYAYNIEDQLASMYDPVVKLRSGGYIVLNPTEALISIDVNSGRSTGERNIEETATKTNLEAVAEIARQLRLRDLAGLIVIDLIDMMDSRNRRSVERALKDALKLDRAKIQLGRISPFGLLEMSRQRLRPSIAETSSMPCPHCQGRGLIRSDASVAIQVIRAMEKEAASGAFSELKLTITPSVALHLLNARRDALSQMERKYNVHLIIQSDTSLAQGIFRLEKVKGGQGKRTAQEPVAIDHQKMMDELPVIEDPTGEDAEVLVSSEEVSSTPREARDDQSHRRGRRGGRNRNRDNRGGRNFNDRGDRPVQDNAPRTEEQGAAPEGAPQPAEGTGDRPRRERGERGGRNRRGGRGRYRDQRGRNEGSVNPPMDGATAQGAPADQGAPRTYQPRSSGSMQSPANNNATTTPPPLEQQGSGVEKPKKGWWRKMIES